MGSLDKTMPALAVRLLAANGKAVTYKAVTEPAYDPTTGKVTPSESATVVSAYLDALKGDQYAPKNMDISKLRMAYVSAQQLSDKKVVPKPGDKLTFDAADWIVLQVFSVYSGDLVALYKIVVTQ